MSTIFEDRPNTRAEGKHPASGSGLAVRHLQRSMLPVVPADLTSERVADYAAFLQMKEWQPSSVNRSRRVLRRVLRPGIEWERLTALRRLNCCVVSITVSTSYRGKGGTIPRRCAQIG